MYHSDAVKLLDYVHEKLDSKGFAVWMDDRGSRVELMAILDLNRQYTRSHALWYINTEFEPEHALFPRPDFPGYVSCVCFEPTLGEGYVRGLIKDRSVESQLTSARNLYATLYWHTKNPEYATNVALYEAAINALGKTS
jgi:hypothetical protein